MTTSAHVLELQKETTQIETKKDSNYYSPTRMATVLEFIIKKPIKVVSVTTIGYYPNKFGINAIIRDINVWFPGSKEPIMARHLLKPDETLYLSLKLENNSKQQYNRDYKDHIVDISDKHSFIKRDTKETVTYWNYTVMPHELTAPAIKRK